MRAETGTAGSPASTRLVLLLALLATLTFEIVAADGERTATTIGLVVLGQMSAVLLVSACLRRGASLGLFASQSLLIWILCLATIPFLVEVLLRAVAECMLPLELLLLSHFRNVVLALAAFAYRADCQRVSCGFSTFLVIFASALATQFWLQGLVVAFSIVGIWWLMGTYWESLQVRIVASTQRDLSRWWWFVLPAGALLVLVTLPVAGMQTHALNGFMPSSGGRDWYDAQARSGVGDGDNLVAGTEHVQSFAPIEDAPFVSSHEPSLYDLFDDTYNEPVKPSNTDRAIALAPQQGPTPKDHHLAVSQQSGKQFSTLRKPGVPQKSKIRDLKSQALMYVKGRVPLHLKLEVFDRYDGIDWFPEALSDLNPSLEMVTLHERPWLRTPVMRSLDIYGAPEIHALKVVHLDTNRIPAPTQLLGIHVDQLDRADFFLWAQPSVVRMDREKLPSLLTLQLQSRVVDERLISQRLMVFSGGSPGYRELADDEPTQQVRALAESWTKGIADGWPQIQTVVARLREDFVHDREARPPENCRHTAAHFLLESRRGPDYQFAAATVVLLRSLGYSARLVNGFYVQPERYEARSRHTPVLAEDVHVWAEVYSGAGDWIPLEPTPGYVLLQPPPTWGDRVQAFFLAAWQFVVARAIPLSLLLVAIAAVIAQRNLVVDLVATTLWRLFPARDARARARQTLKLLDGRCRRSGSPRPRDVAPSRWLQRVGNTCEHIDRGTLREFLRLADWASYAPSELPPPSPQARDLCGDLVEQWSQAALSHVGRPSNSLTPQRRRHAHESA